MINGLSFKEAESRLREFGENAVYKKSRVRPLVEFLKKFRSPLLFILIFVSIISFFLGARTNALIILVMIFVSVILDFINTYQSQKAEEKLFAKVATTATVIRGGKEREIDLRKIVPGDIVRLSAGDIVPADCEVLEADGFFINQAALTGESFPIEKFARQPKEKNEPISPENKNFIFMGTNVIGGYATALVKETGSRTEFGKIAKKLTETFPETDFERGIKKFSYLIVRITVVLVSFVFLANALMGRPVLESFIFAIAIAIGLTPELLPVIMSVGLSRGAIDMAKKDVIVKNLSAIHNFGSMNILATDKTGTLTQNKIVLIKSVDGFGKESAEVLFYSYLSSSFHTGLKNPFDKAIKEHKKLDITSYKKIDEIPFDFFRKRDSIVAEKNKKRIFITKGAPEEMFKICEFYSKEDKKTDLTPDIQRKFENTYKELSDNGFRVLAIAVKDADLKQTVYKKEDEKMMIFWGFMAFLDPPKEGVKENIDRLEELGVEIKIISGDNEVLTQRICREVGVVSKGVMTGEQISRLNDIDLEKFAKNATIFARIDPVQKERIITVLRKDGNVVGFLGDGINDAPALQAADIGISVNNAVDVAKETADIILLQKSLAVLKDGVIEGRKTFQNTLKYIMMGLSSNFGNMFSMTVASLFLPFLPMLPAQILLNNFIYDVSQISLSTDAVDEEAIKKPPRWNLNFIKKFMLVFGPVSSIFDFLTFGALFWIFRLSESQFQTGWFMESIATQIFVIYLIRTTKVPFLQSWPGKLLLANTFLAVIAAWVIPRLSFGKIFQFSPLSAQVTVAIGVIVVSYLLLAEFIKRYFYKKNPPGA